MITIDLHRKDTSWEDKSCDLCGKKLTEYYLFGKVSITRRAAKLCPVCYPVVKGE